MASKQEINQRLSYAGAIFLKVWQDWELKFPFGLVLGFFSFFFDRLQTTSMLALIALISMDFLASLYAIKRTGLDKRGGKISSATALGSAIKTALYFLLISAGFVAEKTIPVNFIDDTIIAFLAVTELISIMENVGRAGYAIPNKLLDALKIFRDAK